MSAKNQNKAPAPAATTTRQSRLPIEAVQKSMTGHELTVADMAKKHDISERDVRLSIDRLRKKNVNVVRSKLKTFTIPRDAQIKI
jgi:hypothetical protein